MTLEPINKLRESSHLDDSKWTLDTGEIIVMYGNEPNDVNAVNWGEQWRNIADEIEAEIADKYLELPLDVVGTPIHVGDKVFWYAVGYFDVIGIGEQVVLDKGDSRFAIVPPDVLEVVDMSARDYVVRFYDSDEPDDFTRMEEVVRCKDCEHRYDNQCGRYPDWFDIELDGYCAWGERKQ